VIPPVVGSVHSHVFVEDDNVDVVAHEDGSLKLYYCCEVRPDALTNDHSKHDINNKYSKVERCWPKKRSG
jgi:hypothetical protein